MGRFGIDRPPGRPRDGAAARRLRRRPLEVSTLETRTLTTITGISVTADTNILTPPDGRLVPVTVTGQVINDNTAAPVVAVQVIDEYRRVNTVSSIPLTRSEEMNGAPRPYLYSVTLHLEASRSDQDRAGRQYYVIITAKDADNGVGRVVPVIVPFDPNHLPSPDDDAGTEAARAVRARSRPRPPRMINRGSARPTGRRGEPR